MCKVSKYGVFSVACFPYSTRKNSLSQYFLDSDTAYNFVNSMIEESKYCNDLMKKNFNKELGMTKTDNNDFENSSKCWICHVYVDGDVKVRDHCDITKKYRVSAHRDCNIKIKLIKKSLVVFHNLKNYDSYLII